MMARLPDRIKLTEVGPRDGLQNEKTHLTVSQRLAFIENLILAGLTEIEVGSFVSPAWVPQMAGSNLILKTLAQKYGQSKDLRFPVLVPNMKGYEAARESGAQDISIFIAASESFSQKNTNATIEESFTRLMPVIKNAVSIGIRVRGYISCVWGCPYEGTIDLKKIIPLCKRLLDAGVEEISLGDTIGVATAGAVYDSLSEILKHTPKDVIAVHFHDTYGKALSNILMSLEMGIYKLDASAGGLGGCPYAKGATGNVATEDVLYMLNGLGITYSGNLSKIAQASSELCKVLGIEPASRVARVLAQKARD